MGRYICLHSTCLLHWIPLTSTIPFSLHLVNYAGKVSITVSLEFVIKIVGEPWRRIGWINIEAEIPSQKRRRLGITSHFFLATFFLAACFLGLGAGSGSSAGGP